MLEWVFWISLVFSDGTTKADWFVFPTERAYQAAWNHIDEWARDTDRVRSWTIQTCFERAAEQL